MTILPDDRYLSRWQRAKARFEALMADFKNWRAGNARMSDRWKPKQLERGYTEVPSEMEKVAQDHKPKS